MFLHQIGRRKGRNSRPETRGRNLMQAKRQTENEAKLADAVMALERLVALRLGPRDLRRAVYDSIASLKDTKQSVGMRAANAISILEEAANHSDEQSSARVTLWIALSELEQIRE